MQTNFENLEIYQLSEKLADRIYEIASGWPHLEQNTVGSQVIRAADSVGANIAEGSGRGTDKDFLRFLKIARGSFYETKHWLRRAYRRKLLTADESTELKEILDELTPKKNAYIRSVSRPKTPSGKTQKPKSKGQSPDESSRS